MSKKCDTCEHHIEHYDEVDGRENHDGCSCYNDEMEHEEKWKYHEHPWTEECPYWE